MRYAVLAILSIFAPAMALPFADYSGCLALVRSNPAKALQGAEEWAEEGGAAADHCAATALTALKRYPEAASRLEALARAPGIGDFRQRAALYDQAGNAWMLAGQPAKAERDFSQALAQTPNDADMLTDRAFARQQLKNWAGVDADLTAALRLDQNRADILVLRASARQALGRMKDAAIDIVQALAIYPDYPPALVERGRMKLAAGDVQGARRDWQKVAKGRGKAAADAKRYLGKLAPEAKPQGKK